jgi:hypothetical protein
MPADNDKGRSLVCTHVVVVRDDGDEEIVAHFMALIWQRSRVIQKNHKNNSSHDGILRFDPETFKKKIKKSITAK